MRARHGYISVPVDTTVDIDLADFAEDVLDQADEATRSKLREALGFDRSATGNRLESVVEEAYMAARQMETLPREIADLFWHVHGRAI